MLVLKALPLDTLSCGSRGSSQARRRQNHRQIFKTERVSLQCQHLQSLPAVLTHILAFGEQNQPQEHMGVVQLGSLGWFVRGVSAPALL